MAKRVAVNRNSALWREGFDTLRALKIGGADVFGDSTIARASADGFQVEGQGAKTLGLWHAADALYLREVRRGARRNPVPASSALGERRAQVIAAARLREDFTGHRPLDRDIVRIPKPEYPDAVLVVGECDGILYTTVRDGEVESYIHRFRKKSRPLLCASPDGKSLYLLGGAYSFTDRGIVDK